MSDSRHYIAVFALVLVTLLWGLTFPLIHLAVGAIDSDVFVCLRFSLATLCVLPLVFNRLRRTNRKIVITGLVLGILNSIAFISQTKGLETLAPAISAFITGLSVLLVPLLLPLFRLGTPSREELLCALLSCLGLYELTGANLHAVNQGAYYTVLCAFAVALTLLFLQKMTKDAREIGLIVFYQVLFTAITSLVSITFSSSVHVHFTQGVILALIYCGLFATGATLFLQTRFQRDVSVTLAALIYTLEPIFTVFFSYWLVGEGITTHEIIGGTFILSSIVFAEWMKKKKREKNESRVCEEKR